jgi:hypothetical protein
MEGVEREKFVLFLKSTQIHDINLEIRVNVCEDPRTFKNLSLPK